MTKLEILAKTVQTRTSLLVADPDHTAHVAASGARMQGFQAMPRRNPAVIHKQHRMQMQKSF